MEKIKLFDGELKLMELLWENEPATAKQLSLLAEQAYAWNKNTTYTVIKKLVEKNAVKRCEPGFMCTANIKKSEVAKNETEALIEKLYNGSKKAFFAAFLEDKAISDTELDELKKMIEER